MKTINLIVRPRETMTWEQFLKETPKYSIALDGYVEHPPEYDPQTFHLNLDHHTGVFRQSTLSTAQQCMMAVKGGLYQSFRKDNRPYVNVYVNDCDQDVALALFILDEYKMFEGVQSLPHFNRLIEIDGKLDMTGGGYPFNLRDQLMRQHQWIFDPYNRLRTSGALASASEQVIADNIETVMGRIMQFVVGNSGEMEIKTDGDVIHDSSYGYKFIDERDSGLNYRWYMYSQGMNAFISWVGTKNDMLINDKKVESTFVYSIGRRGIFIPFPVQYLIDRLNKYEKEYHGNTGWGGSDLIGGSPRENGSCIHPRDLGEIVDAFMFEYEKLYSNT